MLRKKQRRLRYQIMGNNNSQTNESERIVIGRTNIDHKKSNNNTIATDNKPESTDDRDHLATSHRQHPTNHQPVARINDTPHSRDVKQSTPTEQPNNGAGHSNNNGNEMNTPFVIKRKKQQRNHIGSCNPQKVQVIRVGEDGDVDRQPIRLRTDICYKDNNSVRDNSQKSLERSLQEIAEENSRLREQLAAARSMQTNNHHYDKPPVVVYDPHVSSHVSPYGSIETTNNESAGEQSTGVDSVPLDEPKNSTLVEENLRQVTQIFHGRVWQPFLYEETYLTRGSRCQVTNEIVHLNVILAAREALAKLIIYPFAHDNSITLANLNKNINIQIQDNEGRQAEAIAEFVQSNNHITIQSTEIYSQQESVELADLVKPLKISAEFSLYEV